jgi:tetratricopeptide (TPR) repeat protein
MDLSTRQGRKEQGSLLQHAVERAGISVEELAQRVGCSRALIYQYLSGTTLAQPDRLQRIAEITHVPLAYFYGAPLEPAGSAKPSKEPPQQRIQERLEQLEELARAQEAPADWAALASTSDRIVSLAAQLEDRPAQARALVRIGKSAIRRGEFSRALDSLERAALLFTDLADADGLADARQALGSAYLSLGRTRDAREQFDHVVKSSKWDFRWRGAVSLAAVLEQQGDHRAAMEWCDEAASILDERNDPTEVSRGMLYVNGNRVNLFLACGDFLSAEPLARWCAENAEGLGNSDQHLEARLNLALCDLWRGRWVQAEAMLTSTIPLARFTGDKSREAMGRALLGSVLARLGRFDAATEQAKDALSASLSQGDRRTEHFAQAALAEAYAGARRETEARYHANQALAVAGALRLSLYETEARLLLAEVCQYAQSYDEAEEQIHRALRSAEEIGAQHLEAEAYRLLAAAELRHGHTTTAFDYALRAQKQAAELQLQPMVLKCWEILGHIHAAQGETSQAVDAFRHAIEGWTAVRTACIEAGHEDTLLEDPARLDAWRSCLKLLYDTGRNQEAERLLEQSAWPPLAETETGDNQA